MNRNDEDKDDSTTFAFKGQVKMDDTPMDFEMKIDLLEFHKKNARSLHKMVEVDEPPTLREVRRKEFIGDVPISIRNKYWRNEFGHIVQPANWIAISNSTGP